MKTADLIYRSDRHWREAQPEERRMILEEYTSELGRKEDVSCRVFVADNRPPKGRCVDAISMC